MARIKRGNTLTRRQLECLHLLSRGNSSKEIAHHIGISIETVNDHLNQAKKRLSAKNRVEMVIIALRRDLIQL